MVLHVPSPFVPCALARKGGPGGLAPRAGGLGGPSAPPGKQGGLGGGTPPNDRTMRMNISVDTLIYYPEYLLTHCSESSESAHLKSTP